MFPRICIQSSISTGSPTPVLWSEIEATMRSARIQDICDQIKLLDGKDPDELARLKRQLPIITPHACRFTGDGSRKSANAIPSGLVMLDIDHIDDPREFFSTHIFPHLNNEAKGDENIPPSGGNEGGLYFVAITPSGHGLRIIAERKPGETIPDAQQRIAHICRLHEYDAVTTDLARASFLMPWSYVLYCEPQGLNFDTPEQEANITLQFAQIDTKNHTTTTLPQQKVSETPQEKSAPSGVKGTSPIECPEWTFIEQTNLGEASFRGIPYEAIVHALVQLLGGTPEMGERNQVYFTLVRYIRYICNFNAALCVRILPDFGLSYEERMATALSSINRPRKGHIPEIIHRAIIAATQQKCSENNDNTPHNIEHPSLPTLPRVLQIICRRIPQEFHPAMIIAALPILGALATRVRFQYLDKQEHSFSFMSCITAPAATGKSFIRKPITLLLTPISLQDEIERKKEEEYKEALRVAKNSKQQPINPRPCPRNNGINVSVAKLLQLLSYSDGKHLIGIGEEIDTLVKSERAGVWSQKSDIYRLGFDNAKYGQNYMSENSFSANVPVYYNLLLTGTPGGMYNFFKNVEDGLVTRFCFAQLPDMFGTDIPIFDDYTPKEEKEIIEIANRLDQTQGFINCPHVAKRIRKWLNEKRELAIREDSRAIDTLRKRSAVIGYRSGMLAFLLNDCKYDKNVGHFATWVAEYVFQNQMQLFGNMFEQVAQQQLLAQEKNNSVISLLAMLPKQFTRNDLMTLRARNGQSTNVAMIISRWRNAGFIIEVDKNTYQKTNKC